jgi:aspartate aminotransferase
MNRRVRELRAQGQRIVPFSAGELLVAPPEEALAAARATCEPASCRYGDSPGLKPLRELLARESSQRRGVQHALEQVIVTTGAKQALFEAFHVLLDRGDEVIVPTPHWVTYPAQIQLAGGTPITHRVDLTKTRGRLAGLERLVTARTKAIVLNSPCNPTGVVYDADDLALVASLARAHGIWLVCDEVYAAFAPPDRPRSILDVAPDLVDRTIIVDSASKSYALAGWRVGWLIAPTAVAKACDAMQSQMTSHVSVPMQEGVRAAVQNAGAWQREMRAALAQRRDRLVAGLRAVPGFDVVVPEGGIFLLAGVQELAAELGHARDDDAKVAAWLLEHALCAVVPGSAFDAPGYVRFSFGIDESAIEEGLHNLAAARAKARSQGAGA